jgi:hypothetical protein
MFRARKLPCFRARLRQHVRELPQKQSPKQRQKAPRAIAGLFHDIIRDKSCSSAMPGYQQGRAMKHGLAVLAAGLMSLWLAACQPARIPDRITVASLSLNVDASDPAHPACQSFALTRDEVSTYFRTATEVSGPEFHDRSVILPCRYEGTLTMEGGMWSFSINAGGAGYLYRADGTQRRYLCEQRCQRVLARVFGAD